MPGYSASAGSKPGLEIWRIEKMEVAPVDPKTYGQFYSGDCYIVLKTTDKAGSRVQDLHFWLGTESSQDEQGAAAYKTVELDDKLGGKPTQHREVQNHESPLFLSYFPKGITYMEGGVASGFRKVDPDKFDTRLLHIKGKRNVRCIQVEAKVSSLNQGDCFILDMGRKIWQWNGKDANKYEKFKALEIATKIKNDERGGKADLVFLESGKNDNDDAFWKGLGGAAADVASADAGGSDDDVKQQTTTLYRISDASGTLKMDKVAEGRLERKQLDGTDVFLVDSGSEVFVWVGLGATKEERSKSMKYASDFLKENNRPAWVPITRIIESGETPVFKALFAKWEDIAPAKKAGAAAGGAAAKEQKAPAKKAADASALYAQKKQQDAEEKMVDDGSGKLKIWRIVNMAKVDVPQEQWGQFWGGDSYILLYSYRTPGNPKKDSHIIYFWQGRDSSNDEKGASALLAKQLDDDMGGDPVQVRVTQGREPNHFLTLFKGKMVVHEGGVASAFKNRSDKDSMDTDGVSLFHVKGTSELNTKAVQVKEVSASLNSSDCFVLLTPDVMYVWQGKGSNATERKTAGNVAKVLQEKRKLQVIDEGAEPDAFWKPLGGKGEYATSKELEEGAREARLFQCSTVHGSFKIEEVFNFTQEDLINDDVMILDTYSEVFVWIGHDSTKEEKDQAMIAAMNYVKNAPDGRSADTPVWRVNAGAEPPNFTCHFHGWNFDKASDFSDPYLKKLGTLGGAKGVKDQKDAGQAGGAKLERVSAGDIGYLDWKNSAIPLADLQKGTPDKVDPQNKELYLSDDEFLKLFKVAKADWEKQPKWKKDQAKKANKLF